MKNIGLKCKKCRSNKISEKVNVSFQPSGWGNFNTIVTVTFKCEKCRAWGIIKKVV